MAKKDKTLKQIALEDMRAVGVSTMVFSVEIAILEYTKEDCDNYHRRDFRIYNGGPRHSNKKR
jgi:hypothetical protein